MAATRLAEEDFRRTFASVIAPTDRAIVIFSGLWTFAHQFGWSVKKTPLRLLDLIEEVVGAERTLIFPTFTFLSFARSRTFDLVRSPSEVGVLSRVATGRAGYVRTRRPMNSYAVKGPLAADVAALPCTTAWGDAGVMGWMQANDVRFIVLGIPWADGCSIVHRPEEMERVPYRYFKRFKGRLLDDGAPLGECEEVMYVRSLTVSPEFDFTPGTRALERRGRLRSGDNPLIPVASATATDIVAIVSELLRDDPYAFIANRDAVAAWVADGKVREIASLKPDERVAIA